MPQPSSRWEGAITSSENDLWGTPPRLIVDISREFDIVLDAAASKTTKVQPVCPYYLGPDRALEDERDALAIDWRVAVTRATEAAGRRVIQPAVFLNPPYGLGVRRWMAKAAEEAARGWYPVICLVFARTDTEFWHDTVMPMADEVRFIRGRLLFLDPATGEPRRNAKKPTQFQPATAPSALVIFRSSKTYGLPRITSYSLPGVVAAEVP